jgi:hypothetical protein
MCFDCWEMWIYRQSLTSSSSGKGWNSDLMELFWWLHIRSSNWQDLWRCARNCDWIWFIKYIWIHLEDLAIGIVIQPSMDGFKGKSTGNHVFF